MQLHGIHHVTAASATIARNLDFYTNVLGLRLVKKSVNQDDVSAYHLFYADKAGTPGTDMTFFDWPHIGPDRRGSDTIAGTAFRVNGTAALAFWADRLTGIGARNVQRRAFAGHEMLYFEDPEGQRLYLVDDEGAPFEGETWSRPDIPDEYAIRGFYSVILSVPRLSAFSPILSQLLNFEETRRTTWIDNVTTAAVFTTIHGGGPGTEVWVLEEPDALRGHLGAGGVHHVAFRVKDADLQREWRERIARVGLGVSQQIDRFWFRSIYFRVSPGILFEIATDGPGFAVDEDPDKLGEKLVLPPFLEPRRAQIEAGLKPIGA